MVAASAAGGMSERRISGKQELSTCKVRNDIGLFHETLNTISKKDGMIA